jgi:cystathionine beta-lyase/cystathionine gamma-synthase
VIFPGLPDHSEHDLACRQMSGPGAMISVELHGDMDQARRFLSALSLFTLAESLGGVESLAEQPALMTHASIPAAIRAKTGISDALVRLSVGIEGVEDLWADLEQALLASA